jgi:hypothetical protein
MAGVTMRVALEGIRQADGGNGQRPTTTRTTIITTTSEYFTYFIS